MERLNFGYPFEMVNTITTNSTQNSRYTQNKYAEIINYLSDLNSLENNWISASSSIKPKSQNIELAGKFISKLQYERFNTILYSLVASPTINGGIAFEFWKDDNNKIFIQFDENIKTEILENGYYFDGFIKSASEIGMISEKVIGFFEPKISY